MCLPRLGETKDFNLSSNPILALKKQKKVLCWRKYSFLKVPYAKMFYCEWTIVDQMATNFHFFSRSFLIIFSVSKKKTFLMKNTLVSVNLDKIKIQGFVDGAIAIHSHIIIKKASLSESMARASIIGTNDQLNHFKYLLNKAFKMLAFYELLEEK